MICYKDKTYCTYDTCQLWGECHRALTIRVAHDAEKWWNSDNPPIARFGDQPNCFKDKDAREAKV